MLVCQAITVIWLWHESQEQIDILVDMTLNKTISEARIREEKIEAIMALLFSTLMMIAITLFLSYKAIQWIVKPLEILEKELNQRTAENLASITTNSELLEIQSITSVINDLFIRLNDTLTQERLFTADVAHELRTPLAGIRLHLELISKTHQIDCSELIQRIDRLVSTVEQLLMLARASQKFTMGQYQLIHFNQDIKVPLFEEFFELAIAKQQHIAWRLPTTSASFTGDVTLIRLLVRNLVENACRYSPAETTISIACFLQDNRVNIEVIDEGSGIDESKREMLTHAFFRMDRRYHGIGLGLSIVNRIVKLHQGQFMIKNRQDGQTGTITQCIFPEQFE